MMNVGSIQRQLIDRLMDSLTFLYRASVPPHRLNNNVRAMHCNTEITLASRQLMLPLEVMACSWYDSDALQLLGSNSGFGTLVIDMLSIAIKFYADIRNYSPRMSIMSSDNFEVDHLPHAAASQQSIRQAPKGRLDRNTSTFAIRTDYFEMKIQYEAI